MSIRKWRDAVEEVLLDNGVCNIGWEQLGAHQRVSGTVRAVTGKPVTISLVCSVTPSDHKAIHRVRQDCKRAIQAARRLA